MLGIRQRLRGKSAPQPNGCVYFTGFLNHDGYGKIRVGSKVKRAHRAMWECTKGPIPEGMRVLHRCDTPRCIALECLFLGTQADNVADMRMKGRERKALGSKNSRAKLTARQIRRIRIARGHPVEIGQRFGITRGHVCKIKRRALWAHLP